MLEEVLRYINNRFEVGILEGTFTVADGTIDVPSALEGQYFWVEGSALNDGLHLNPAADMRSERFTGRIVLMAVPAAVVKIAEDIGAWNEKNADALSGIYQSESFGGYSYSRGTQTDAAGNAMAAWQARFAQRLRGWRKLSRNWV